MILVDLTISIEKIPLKTPFITALRRVEHVETVRVVLTDASGETGTGEAPPTKAITGEDCESIIAALETFKPALLHTDFKTIDDAMETLHKAIEGNSSAKAAIDMALYDLFAKKAGMPLYRYLGGSLKALHTDVTISLKTPEAMAEDALKALSEGFNILKVKVGGNDGLDIDRVRAVRKAAGSGATLLIDANQAWDEAQTMAFIDALKSDDIALIEQPVPANELEAMQRITQHSPIPILADESVFTLEDARKVVSTNAGDLINIKLMKCGGIYKAKQILEYCRKNGVQCMMGSMLEGPVSIAAALHLCMAYGDVIVWHDLDSPLLYRALPASAPLTFEKNLLTLTNEVGI